MPRVNGFGKPFHPLQVMSWVLFGLFGVGFYMFFAPALPFLLWKILASVVYTIVLAVVVWSTALATKANVVDPNVAARGFPQPLPENAHSSEELLELREKIDQTKLNWCPYCNWSINKKSKHCRVCDRCVDIFDHHCKWLNNCIGVENYKLFFISITSVEILLLIQLGIGILIFIETYFLDEGFSTGFLPVFVFRIIVGGYILCLTIISFSLGQLLLLHVSLVKRGLTTYEWIIQNREKAQKRKERREQSQRVLFDPPRVCCQKVQVQPHSKAIVPGTINSDGSSQSIFASDGSPASSRRKPSQSDTRSSNRLHAEGGAIFAGRGVMIKPEVTNTVPGYSDDVSPPLTPDEKTNENGDNEELDASLCVGTTIETVQATASASGAAPDIESNQQSHERTHILTNGSNPIQQNGDHEIQLTKTRYPEPIDISPRQQFRQLQPNSGLTAVDHDSNS